MVITVCWGGGWGVGVVRHKYSVSLPNAFTVVMQKDYNSHSYYQSPLIRDNVFFTLLQVSCLENCTKINNCHIELTLQW